MSQSPNRAILNELRAPTSARSQVEALRKLKNEIIGDKLKKELWLRLGILPYLGKILTSRDGAGLKQGVGNDAGRPLKKGPLSGQDEVVLQAVIIIGSIASGGAAFFEPIIHTSLISELLSIISSPETHSSLIVSCLRTLSSIAESGTLQHPMYNVDERNLSVLLFSPQYIQALARIIRQPPSNVEAQQSIASAIALLCHTCKDELHRTVLADGGVLDALVTQLARYIVLSGYVIPGTDPRMFSHLMQSCADVSSSALNVGLILRAIAVIIYHSKPRARRLASNPDILSVFPDQNTDSSPGSSTEKKTGRNSYPSIGQSDLKPLPSPLYAFLPRLPKITPTRRESLASSNHPPFGGLRPPRCFTNDNPVPERSRVDVDIDVDGEDESLLIPWLFELVRSGFGDVRLSAAWLLAILCRFGFVRKGGTMLPATLLVPTLAHMLDKDYKSLPEPAMQEFHDPPESLNWQVKEKSPFILSNLVADSPDLQKAAVDADVIKKLSQLLKESYDPLPASGEYSTWMPGPFDLTDCLDESLDPIVTQPGHEGISPAALHVLRFRESVLKALAAIAPFKDEYRKSIVDNGVVPFIIESLQPYPSTPTGKEDEKTKGNPISVLLAASTLARALSRSVSILRTSMIDAGITAPLFQLLENPNQEVQVAATAVICNLVLEFSPMRDAILKENILKILCEHAHSMNTRLRLDSVWALKNLVYTAPPQIKKACIEEFGAGWLQQIICDGEEAIIQQRPRKVHEPAIALGSSNAAGERVDLLNAAESPEAAHKEDEEMEDSNWADDENHNNNHSPFKPEGILSGEEAEREHEARMDDLAVQEQGLDLIRNLICAPGAGDMIDYLFGELGHNKVFDILAMKLRPKPRPSYASNISDAKDLTAETENLQTTILISACYVLVSIAAGLPRHRQLLISQTDLLKLLMPLFDHHNSAVRTACLWVIINLTWVDDEGDRDNCRQRALELERLGVLRKLREFENDPELDVKERTKTAIQQMTSLLNEGK